MKITLWNMAQMEIGTFEIKNEDQIKIYEILQRALDHNPSTPEFKEKILSIKNYIDEEKAVDVWINELQTIKTKVEKDDVMCFILEDWITEWFIADFIDARYKILSFS